MEIIPAIMPKNYEDLKNKVALVRGLSETVQIDLMDGRFVKGKTWPFNEMENPESHFQRIIGEEEGLPFWEDIDYELDLMVLKAVDNFDLYLKLGPKRIIFHIEAVVYPDARGGRDDLKEFKEFLEGIDMYLRENTEIGVAINTTTPVEQVFPLVPYVDFIQCMGIEHIGKQGELFDERVFGHIKTLKERFPGIIISVDGGVNMETAPALLEAGADRLVAGSAIFASSDIRGAIYSLQRINKN